MRTTLIHNETDHQPPNHQAFTAALGYAATWAMQSASYPVAVLHVLPDGDISACYYDTLEWRGVRPKFAMLGVRDHDAGSYSFHS
jgi:hypothetical protein